MLSAIRAVEALRRFSSNSEVLRRSASLELERPLPTATLEKLAEEDRPRCVVPERCSHKERMAATLDSGLGLALETVGFRFS